MFAHAARDAHTDGVRDYRLVCREHAADRQAGVVLECGPLMERFGWRESVVAGFGALV